MRGKRVRNCELLKQFYEEQNVLIQLVDNLVLDSVKKGSFSTSNMGGKSGTLEYRLICTSHWVQLKIFDTNYVFEYSMDFEFDSWDCCQFFGDPLSSGVNFGRVQDDDKIWVQDRERLKVLQYPVPEEQYFQYLTLFDMSSEDLYQYFVDIKKEHQCVLQLIAEDSTGIEQFANFLNEPSITKKVRDDIRMIEYAFRRTAKL